MISFKIEYNNSARLRGKNCKILKVQAYIMFVLQSRFKVLMITSPLALTNIAFIVLPHAFRLYRPNSFFPRKSLPIIDLTLQRDVKHMCIGIQKTSQIRTPTSYAERHLFCPHFQPFLGISRFWRTHHLLRYCAECYGTQVLGRTDSLYQATISCLKAFLYLVHRNRIWSVRFAFFLVGV